MYLPRIDPDLCDSCGECIDVCPAEVLMADNETTIVVDPGQCLGCESCVSVCDKEAVTVEEI